MSMPYLKAALEALLFMHHKPVSLTKLKSLIDEDIEMDEYKAAMQALSEDYSVGDRGIEVVEVANGFQFRTKIEHRELIQRLFQINPIKLSQAALEVLSVVAYKQPCTRDQIDQVRGVDCGQMLRNLMDKKMVKMVGKSDAVGKPMLYGTTREFLEIFGLRTLGDLPSLQDIEDMLPKNEVGAEQEEDAIQERLSDIVENAEEVLFNDLELEDDEFSDEAAAKSAGEDDSEEEVDEFQAAADEANANPELGTIEEFAEREVAEGELVEGAGDEHDLSAEELAEIAGNVGEIAELQAKPDLEAIEALQPTPMEDESGDLPDGGESYEEGDDEGTFEDYRQYDENPHLEQTDSVGDTSIREQIDINVALEKFDLESNEDEEEEANSLSGEAPQEDRGEALDAEATGSLSEPDASARSDEGRPEGDSETIGPGEAIIFAEEEGQDEGEADTHDPKEPTNH